MKVTNIIQRDTRYRRVAELWRELDLFELVGAEAEEPLHLAADADGDLSDYAFCSIVLAFFWLDFHRVASRASSAGSVGFARGWWRAEVSREAFPKAGVRVVMRWEPRDKDEKKILSRTLQKKWPHHPTKVVLEIMPVARSLYGTENEIDAMASELLSGAIAKRRKQEEKNKHKAPSSEVGATILVHLTEPRLDGPTKMPTDAAPSSIRRMLNTGDSFWSRGDFEDYVIRRDKAPQATWRVGLMPASPIDINSLERFQRLILMHTLGTDLIHGVHPTACPVCGHSLDVNPLDATSVGGECPGCKARWSVRTCDACGGKVPKLEPPSREQLGKVPHSDNFAEWALAREQVLSRDYLSAPCESSVPTTSGLRVICPHCGACPGSGHTRNECSRCAEWDTE